MRAVASDREAAEMLGINVNRTIALTFFIGSVMAGVAGVMSGLEFQSISAHDRLPGRAQGVHRRRRRRHRQHHRRDDRRDLHRHVRGVQPQLHLRPKYSDLIVFGILIVMMLVRPTGIFGRRALQKV